MIFLTNERSNFQPFKKGFHNCALPDLKMSLLSINKSCLLKVMKVETQTYEKTLLQQLNRKKYGTVFWTTM